MKSIMLGDYLTEEQLRTLVKDYQVEQKHGSDNRTIGGSRTPKSRQRKELSGIQAVRAKVSWMRRKRYEGKWESRKPYMTFEEAAKRYEQRMERRYERLESGEEIFAIMQGERTRKKADVRAQAIKANRPCPGKGGRIVHRPEIKEERCSKPIRVKSERSVPRSGRLI